MAAAAAVVTVRLDTTTKAQKARQGRTTKWPRKRRLMWQWIHCRGVDRARVVVIAAQNCNIVVTVITVATVNIALPFFLSAVVQNRGCSHGICRPSRGEAQMVGRHVAGHLLR